MRQRSTNVRGGVFGPLEIQYVWNKGTIIPGLDPNLYRKDTCNARMHRWSYGETTTYGWEIDHIKPVSKGGTDHLLNLQPMQWQNNRIKSDSYPYHACAVKYA